MELTQKNFDMLTEGLNHRMTKVETSLKWIKCIVGYIAVILTALLANAIIS